MYSFPTLCYSGFALLIFAGTPHALASAQESPALRHGERVEVRIVGQQPSPAGVWCAASVADAQRDTLLLDRSESCPRGSYLADLRVARGESSRLSHAVLGTIVGAVAGGLIASGTAGSGCQTDICSDADGGYAAGAQTMAGVVTGALVLDPILKVSARASTAH